MQAFVHSGVFFGLAVGITMALAGTFWASVHGVIRAATVEVAENGE